MMEALFVGFGLEGATKGLLAFGHLIGLVLGLGTTVYLDGGCFLSIARRSWSGYQEFMAGALFKVATKYVVVGLAILWVSGCGFLIHYSVFSPEKLANPKLLAKFAVVSVLTLNGYLLHYHVLKRVAGMRECGRLLRSRVGPLCLFSGAVSSASWIMAFLLGALPVLNNTVGFTVFVLGWAGLALAIYFSARIAIARAARHEIAPEAGHAEVDGARVFQAMKARPTPVRIASKAVCPPVRLADPGAAAIIVTAEPATARHRTG